MIISVTNLKGGVGKSTISQNLAVWFAHQGKRVCILDTDMEQRTSMRWAGLRGSTLPYIAVFGVESDQIIRTSAKQAEDYDIIIIDGTPQLGKTALATVMASDMVLVPITPSAFDMWSFENFLNRYQEVKEVKTAKDIPFKAYIILNKFTGKTNLDKNVLDVIQDFDMGVLETKIGDRVAYRECPITGLGVVEMKEKKSKAEIEQLGEEVLTKIKNLHS
ncbi:MAG: AAA family ATPase [Saprospiraceae bacterium]|nr:AAA family ATPase [Saprospiraceae bacterium]